MSFPEQCGAQKSDEMKSEKRALTSSSPDLEVNGSVPLTPLTATTTSRTDQMHTQSPKLVRRTAFRETVKEHRKGSHDSPVTCASPTPSAPVVFTLGPDECVHSPSVSSQSYVPCDPDSRDLENGFDAPHPSTKQPSTSSKASGTSSEAGGCSSRSARGRRKRQTKEEKGAEQKSAARSGLVLETYSGCPSLKHASSAPYSLMCEDEGVFHSGAPGPHPALVGGSITDPIMLV